MPKWRGEVVETYDETVEYWKSQSLETIDKMMHVGKKRRLDWLRVTTDIITEPGSIFEPGCGDGIMVETIPDDCTYYGVDINEGFVDVAKSRYCDKTWASFGVEDAFNVKESYDWVIVNNLFGMFPVEDSYNLLRDLWSKTSKGLAVSTLNFHKYDNPRARKNRITSHKPEELLEIAKGLPGVGEIRMETDIKDGNLNRKFVTFIYRDSFQGEVRTPEYLRGKSEH